MSYAKANAVLNAALYAPATPYVMLHVGDPGAAGPANEAQKPSEAGDIDRKAATFGEAAAGTGEQVSTTTADIDWSGAEIATGQEITHFSIWDAETAGDCLFIAAVDTPKTTGSDGVTIATGDLEVALGVYAVEPA
jgi:hypothetical protein